MTDHDTFPGGKYLRSMSTDWISDDLFLETRRVWEDHLGRPVPDEEIIEMLLNVKKFAEVMLRAGREMQKNESTEQPGS